MSRFSIDHIEDVALRFRALGEPARLRILDALRGGEKSVSQIMAAVELSQANVSKHLHVLHELGFVLRRKQGLFVYYELADRNVFRLCEMLCGSSRVKARTSVVRAAD